MKPQIDLTWKERAELQERLGLLKADGGPLLRGGNLTNYHHLSAQLGIEAVSEHEFFEACRTLGLRPFPFRGTPLCVLSNDEFVLLADYLFARHPRTSRPSARRAAPTATSPAIAPAASELHGFDRAVAAMKAQPASRVSRPTPPAAPAATPPPVSQLTGLARTVEIFRAQSAKAKKS